MEWQPIETAPKDCTRVLLYGLWAGEIASPNEDGEPIMVVGYWSGYGGDHPGYDWDVEGSCGYAAWMKPTHWMPLPKAPE